MDRVVYCKSSNERDRRFALHTLMMERKDGERYFLKVPDAPESEQHVQRIACCEQKLKAFYDPDQMHINRCRRRDNGVELECLEGTTLEEEIDETFIRDGAEPAMALIEQFFLRIQPRTKRQPFTQTEEFINVFGIHPELENIPALPIADIDMIFANVICNTKGWHLIDYEWTFFCPIPVEFLKYRALHYFLETSGRREWLRKVGWERWGIEPGRIPLWETLEGQFQKYIRGDYTTLQELYEQITPGITELRILDDLDRRRSVDAVRIYWSKDGTFSEERVLLFPWTDGWNTIRARLPVGTNKIRIDPGERSGICSLRRCSVDGKAARIKAQNGMQVSDEVWVFPQEDPQWTVVLERTPVTDMEMEIKIQPIEAELLGAIVTKAGRKKYRRFLF